MTCENQPAEQIQSLVSALAQADALKGENFHKFLDLIPIAIVVARVDGEEHIIYANPECARVLGVELSEIVDKPWSALTGVDIDSQRSRGLAEAIVDSADCVGTFRIERPGQEASIVDAYANVIEDDGGAASYRLAAFLESGGLGQAQREAFEQQLRDKDTLLFEIQHRVKNNLQMIAALIRIEARNAGGRIDTAPFDRLAGRIQAIQTLYTLLSADAHQASVDLGVYLSQIASTVLGMHSVEGVTLDLKVDTCPVSVDVAMPTGLVINELLTNALKHAFAGREGGTILLHSRTEPEGCRITVSDDGVGLPAGVEWPTRGKLGAAIAQSLRDNASADIDVRSVPGQGTRVTISFPTPEPPPRRDQ